MASETSSPQAKTPFGLYAALAFAALAAAALLYVVLAPAAKPGAGPMTAYAKGALEKLAVMPDPPAQPETPLVDAQGGVTTLPAMRGKVVLVNLWATWCAPCREEMPTLAALHQRFAGRDFAVVAISMDTEAKHAEAAQALAPMTDGALAFYAAPSISFASNLGAPGLPATILYDRQGREIARLLGAADWGGAEAARLVEAALAQP